MNKLNIKERARILGCLVTGNSIRAAVRMTGAAKNTVAKLLADVGAGCAEYQHKTLRNLSCKRLRCDEVWSFVDAKADNAPNANSSPEGAVGVWTWSAVDEDTKLVPAWTIGPRDSGVAYDFMLDLSDRLVHRVQLTIDGHKVYLDAVEGAVGANIDYAMLVNLYGEAANAGPESEYGRCHGATPIGFTRDSDMTALSTSYVASQNVTAEIGMHRLTRLTGGFSRKLESLSHAVALHFMYYNFGRIHQALLVTPAVAAGVSDHVWELDEIAALVK